jgi:hypothetical protein
MNHRHIFLQISILAIILVLHPECERNDFSWGTKIGNITYSGNVVFIGSEELASIGEVSASRVVFTTGSHVIEKITDKTILLMGVSDNLPYGSLRKVVSIQQNGSETIVNTKNASLAEAIKEGTVNLQEKLSEKDFSLKTKVDGVLIKGPSKSFDGLAVTLDDLEIFREGNSFAKLSGAIGVSPEVGIFIKVVSNKISEINYNTSLGKIDEVTVTSNGAFSGSNEIVTAEFVHSPIIIDSLVFVPEVTVKCGYEGSTSGAVSSGVRQDRDVTSSIFYHLSSWSKNPLSHTETYDYVNPQLTGSSNLQIYSGPEITIRLFGIPIQTLKLEGFYTLETQASGNSAWKLFIGSDGFNTARAEIFGLNEDFTSKVATDVTEIASSDRK